VTDEPISASGRSPRLVTTRQQLREAIQTYRQRGKSIGLVPTMGALHEDHLTLVDASRSECDATVVTIFVNPTQFGPGEDFAAYPRDLATDLAALGRRGADLVFAPSEEELYGPHHATYVEPGGAAETLEGAARPGHFRGVATIVLKLFNLVAADVAFFGQKDYQQTLVVRQLVRDFDVPIAIRVCPIVRQHDQLAMSSRNAYLTPAERRQALSLWRGLERAEALYAAGERSAATIAAAVRNEMAQGGVVVDYVALVENGTVTPVEKVDGPTVVLVAGKVGKTRLIDNRLIGG